MNTGRNRRQAGQVHCGMDNCRLREIEQEARAEAERGEMSIDDEVYRRSDRDPLAPILFAGSLHAPVAFVARDLGKDEVAAGQPLIGSAGRRVRGAIYQLENGKPAPSSDRKLESILDQVLLTNTVPYKPVGNKAYPPGVRERFRPHLSHLLTSCWQGTRIITLGTEAFMWFAPYAPAGAIKSFWEREDRFESEIECTLRADCGGETIERKVMVGPLPHPSPLNQTYLALFPGLLERRLQKITELSRPNPGRP